MHGTAPWLCCCGPFESIFLFMTMADDSLEALELLNELKPVKKFPNKNIKNKLKL